MNLLYFSSLRARLMLLILLGTIPLLIMVIYIGFEERNHAEDNIKQAAKHIVTMAANEQRRLVRQTQQILSMLGQIPEIKRVNRASCSHLLLNLLKEAKTYANFGVFDLNGDVVCSALAQKEYVNVSDRPYFKETLKTRGFVIGDYQIGRISKKPVMVFSYPLFNDKKQMKAVLFAALPLIWLKNLTSEYSLLPGSLITVFDNSSDKLLAQYSESSIVTGLSLKKQSKLIELIHASDGTGTGYTSDSNGVKRIHVFRRLHDLPNGKFINISLSTPVKKLFAEADASMLRNLYMLLSVVVLITLITWYSSTRLVVRQVAGLLKVTRRVASGDLDARFDGAKSKNEISQLGNEFNTMAEALKRRDKEVKQAEYLLLKNEAKLRHVVESVPDILYTTLAKNIFDVTFVSPAVTRLLGYTEEEYLGVSNCWRRNIYDADRDRVVKYMEYIVNSTTSNDVQFEYRMWHKNRKHLLWFEDRAYISRDEAGVAKKIYGVMTNITENMLSKQKLIDSEERFRSINRVVKDGIIIIDHNGKVTGWNPAAEDLLGYQHKEILGKKIHKVIAPSRYHQAINEGWGPFRESGNGSIFGKTRELYALHKDGSEIPVELSVSAMKLKDKWNAVGVVRDIRERKKYIAELEHKALYDHLTELPNRSLFKDRLEHALNAAQRDNTSLAVLTVDIVRLREVNDILGHNSGDLVIQAFAERLQKTLRTSDTVARLGGDEYAMVLSNVNMNQATVAASKIRKLFEEPVVVEDFSLEIEAVVGIALYPEHSNEADKLLQYADMAMHAAKNEALGYAAYRLEENSYSLQRLKLFGELRNALEYKELNLYYQPQIDINTGRIIGVEALARWTHKTEGMIPPDLFIPMIEQSGLIQPFTLWVLEEAIKQLKSWLETGIELSISVNLSTRNLLDINLSNDIKNLLQRYMVNPALLILEVTESAVMTQPENALKVLTQLHEMGHKLSIDDFGTGYSSLAYLKKLPAYELKIDQSFIKELATNGDDGIIVRSTIELAQNMGLKVVAEGVENQDILDMLKILKCDIAQGHLISQAQPIEELDQWLVDSLWGIKKMGFEYE